MACGSEDPQGKWELEAGGSHHLEDLKGFLAVGPALPAGLPAINAMPALKRRGLASWGGRKSPCSRVRGSLSGKGWPLRGLPKPQVRAGPRSDAHPPFTQAPWSIDCSTDLLNELWEDFLVRQVV